MLVLVVAGAIGASLGAFWFFYTRDVRSVSPVSEILPAAEAAVPANEWITETVPLKPGDNLADLLINTGVHQADQAEVIAAVQKTFDVRKLRAGAHLMLTRSESGALQSLEYAIDPDRRLQLSNSGGVFEAAIVEVPGTMREFPVCGVIEGSLFESMEQTGESPDLALRMAEIFAWDLDFYTDPREGDEFCLLVEKKEYVNGQPPTYQRILAARYNNAGAIYEAYLFPHGDGKPQYYSRDGRSLQSAFLRSPMKFDARVSSRFSHRRFHPVLKTYRPHLGTDYAAPTGTPVQAVAAGQVTFSGRSGGAGNLIRIRHSGGYETLYLHLSRRLVRTGQRVQQGQRIGSVGATGLATGPHLDFRVRQNGRFVDFERLRPPRASQISAAQNDAFAAARDRFVALMESGSPPVVASAASGRPHETEP
jgi:murein DD-endopeptidase MepM/ murein hydrolase activator NlpD